MRYIAVDCGAGSVRIIVGGLLKGKVELDEIYRFSNNQIRLGNNVYWNFLTLFEEIKKGIGLAIRKYNDIVSIGVDTWGVDYGLLDENERLIGNPFSYRDRRTETIPEQVYKIIGQDDIYSVAGTQPMDINTIFQLLSMHIENSPQLKIAKHLLFMPDLINYFLTGIKKSEYTIASTSSLLDAKTRNWSDELLEALGLNASLMCDVIFPGYLLGKVKKEICQELGCDSLDVIAVGSHDTASAAAITYTKHENVAFLSSGTWSLIGTQIKKPILNAEALQHNFTNEGGVNNDILFIKNLTGLWLVQRVLAQWKQEDGSEVDFEELITKAATCSPAQTCINTDDNAFINPDDMCATINAYCRNTGIPVPKTRAETIRLLLESLAMKYKESIELLQQITKKKIEKIHIVGGGCQNELLNQLTSNYTGLPVMAGPVEATAMGNILMQAIARKELKNIEEAEHLVAGSVSLKYYLPEKTVAYV